MSKRVAIIGAAYRMPGTTPESFWSDLVAQKDLVTQVEPDRWSHDAYQHPDRRHPGTSVTFAAGSVGDISGFDAEFFGISPREALHMDPQQRILLELAWEAIEDAGIAPSTLRGSRCGVFVGIASIDYAYRLADDLAALDAPSATGNTSSIASNRISYQFDLRGPSMSVDTACSSSLVAFHQACQAIRSGETDMALTGGISLHLHPYGFIIFSKASMLSANGRCRVFDEDGDGYVRSEGAGLFLLKDYDRAVADDDPILAVVAGSAVNTDGHKSGLTVPNPDAQAALMQQAYTQAGITPDEIDYLEAHGTGTAVGDPIETRAISQALARHRSTPLPIGSVKSNVGHLETASGIAGLTKALYSLHHRQVPATIGIRNLNPRIKFDEWNLEVVTRNQPLKREGRLVIGVNSFGFGGANAHVILESPPAPSMAKPTGTARSNDSKGEHTRPLPLQLSARSEPALRAMAGQLAEWLKQSDDALYDIAYTLRHHREHHSNGALLMVDDRQDAMAQLTALVDSEAQADSLAVYGQHLPNASAPVFVYAGNGCQWETMGAELLSSSAVFAAAVDDVDALFQQYADFSLRAELEGRNGVMESGASRLTLTEIAQPALFAVQVGLTQLLRTHGIEPAAVAGHSVGEVAAAWACGALSLADAVKVIYYRSDYQGKTRGQGEMSAAALSEAEALELLASAEFQGIHLAGINSSRGVTLAGDPEALGRLEAKLAEQGTIAKRLPLDYAFHSPAMDPVHEGIMTALAEITPQQARTPYFSTVSGNQLTASALDAEYWWHNIRKPVLFDAAIKALIETGSNTFIEIGAHPILRRYLNDALRDSECEGAVLTTLERNQPATACITRTLGQALLTGMPLDTQGWFPVAGQRVALPRYPWQRERYWLSGTPSGQGLLERYYDHPLLGYRLAQQANTWESQLDTHRLPWLADHRVGEATVFPGAGFVELALAAGSHIRDAQIIDIEELEIRAPLLLDTQHGRQTRLHHAADDGRIEIRSREPLAEAEWQLNAVARLMQQSRGLQLQRQAPQLPQREPDVTLQTHLAQAEQLGLHYGPAFQAIHRAWVEGERVIGDIALPPAISETLDTLHLHPGILDSAFQLFIPLLAREGAAQGFGHNGIAFVPVQVERIQFMSNAGVPALAQATLGQRSPHSFTADFELYDAQGHAIAVLSGTRFKAIRLKRQQHQHLSYLDIALTPAPRKPAAKGLAWQALHKGIAELTGNFSQLTEQRYANEVDPLLDSLADAFAAAALRQLAGGANLSHARYRELTRTHLGSQRLLDQLLRQLDSAGRLSTTEQGWQLSHADEEISATDIWQLLIRDYPDDFTPVQRLGRFGLHLPALLEGSANADTVGLDRHVLANLSRQLIGTTGWQAIANTLRDTLNRLLAELPAGHRLHLLEAGSAAPALSERLFDLFHVDRCDLSLLTVDDQAWHQAEQLRERLPLTHVERLELVVEGDGDATAQFAIVCIEPGHRERSRRLLNAVTQRLAPGAQLLVLGIEPSAWLDTLLATPGLEDEGQPLYSTHQTDVIAQLDALGFGEVKILPLEESERGAYLLHAQWSDTVALADSPHAPGATSSSDYQLIADDITRDQAQQIATELQRLGHTAQVLEAFDNALPGVRIIDLRQGDERCTAAVNWAKELEPLGEQVSLWLITRGVAAMWSPTMQAPAKAATPSTDAALWGFGRSLANESTGYPVRLLDLPAGTQRFDDAVLNALLTELTAPDNETEIILDAQGLRFATRLRTGPAPGAGAMAANAESQRQAVTLGFELPGQLRNLRWQSRPLPLPGENEVEIRVCATGLNFRDVMYTLGLLSDEAIENGFAGPTLGLEFSGVVEAVGEGVHDLAPGDAIVGFGPASFSNRLVINRQAVAPIPAGTSFAAAATIPTTFFTVYYALKHLARVAPGEHLLIHGAAGGVGIAAIQIAQWLGAEIHATVGSDEKRDFLRLMGVERIYHSRSLTFAEEILAATNGRGVDVVLNSLAGEAINQNLRALRPFGRFLELGKRDFYENTRIGLRPFRNNLSYFGIDSDQLMKAQPELTGQLFAEMMALFADGTLTPLPYTPFSNRQVVEAFRYMQQARQIGKVVVTHETALVPELPQPLPNDPLVLPEQASYLVTGGLGGFGLKSAQWLASRGARHLILVGRSGAASEEAQQGVAELEAQGVEVVAAACDITDRKALAALLTECRDRMPPLRGVIHAATVIDDGLIRNLDAEKVQRVLAPKIDGARHLDELTRDATLDFFVLYSSATTLFGNPGQASYVAANHWLEALAANRLAQGRPATCLCWGAIEDVGFLARNTRTRDALQERLGGSALRSDDALRVLEAALQHSSTQHGPALGVLELDWHALARFLPTATVPRFNEIVRQAGDDKRSDGEDENLAALFADLTPEELHGAVTDLLRAELATILLIDEDKIDINRSVYEMGFDSLMGVELMTAIESRLGVQVPVMVLSEASTLSKLAGVLIQRLHHGEDTEEQGEDITIASLASQHGATELANPEDSAS